MKPGMYHGTIPVKRCGNNARFGPGMYPGMYLGMYRGTIPVYDAVIMHGNHGLPPVCTPVQPRYNPGMYCGTIPVCIAVIVHGLVPVSTPVWTPVQSRYVPR